MDLRNNPDIAPEDHPSSPSDFLYLKNNLERVQRDNDDLNVHVRRMEEQKVKFLLERENFCHRVHNCKLRISRLEGLLEIRERQFKDEYKKIITKHESEISSLKKTLEQFQVQRVDIIPHQSKQEYEDMAAQLKAEKQKLSEQSDQILKLTLQNQNSFILQNELQRKVIHVEQQLHQRDKEILDIRKEKDGLAQRLTEATNNLWSNGAEFLQSDKLWQRKYKVLQEKFRKEIAEKELSWETRVKQVEEEKKNLAEKERSLETRVNQLEEEKKELEELCLKNKTQKMSKKDKREMKKKQKEEEEEMKKKEKQEKTEMKKKENEMKKKKKGFMSWMHWKKKCDSDSEEEEEAACCSSQVGQQCLPHPPPFTSPPSLLHPPTSTPPPFHSPPSPSPSSSPPSPLQGLGCG